MKTVSVINFKGGVGKTTLSFHLACFLARTHRVLVVDVDHQSSLSIVALGSELWQKCVEEERTANKIFEAFCNHNIPTPDSSIIVKNAIFARNGNKGPNFYPNLDFVSGQFELDDTEIDLASTNYGNLFLSDWEKRTILARWLDKIGADQLYDYVIFDCPPATKIVSQNAIVASDKYVIPVIPEDIASRGVTHFRNLVSKKIDDKVAFLRTHANVTDKQTPANYVPKTELAGIAPFLVRHAGRAASGYTNLHTEQLAALRTRWGTDVIGTEAIYYTGIAEALNSGWPVWNYWGQNAKKPIKQMMMAICSDLKSRIDK
jgi:chromosome partitioning protein